MIDIKKISQIQSDFSVLDRAYREAEMTFDDYVSHCRLFVRKNLSEEYSNGDWDEKKKADFLNKLVTDFVGKHPVKVKGYTNNGIVNKTLLLEDLGDVMTGVSVLKEALQDPEVDEIQINDKNTIFVIRNGVTEPYVDSKGRIMQFSDNEEVHIVLNKIIDDGQGNTPQFTSGLPLLNAKTAKDQYRVNAVHHVANTRDKPPASFPITTVVLRKFKETKLELHHIIEGGACTPKMGRLVDKLGRAELKLFCVGPTGSGKTTLLRIIASTIPRHKRIIMIQNPAEITFMERDDMGRNIRNVVHHEVRETGEKTDDKVTASMENLISNSLRETPEVVLIGEARTPGEFFQIQRAMKTGHKLLGTFHAEDAYDAIGRFATELSTTTNATYTECVRLVADTINIIISQYKFENGDRRIMEISEVQGVDDQGYPKINMLFEYKLSGKVHTDERGRTVVEGEFVQRGILSPKLKKVFYKAGISYDDIAEFCNPKDIVKDEEEAEEEVRV
ncbi:Type IV secretion system protein PtlH [compost metagenome]